MKRFLVIPVLAALGMSLCADTAFAGRRHRCCMPQPSCCAPAPTCATAMAAPVVPQPDPATAPQAGGPQTYQSFSYEPGATATATPVAPTQTFAPVQRAQPRGNSFYDSVRGDRKARGF